MSVIKKMMTKIKPKHRRRENEDSNSTPVSMKMTDEKESINIMPDTSFPSLPKSNNKRSKRESSEMSKSNSNSNSLSSSNSNSNNISNSGNNYNYNYNEHDYNNNYNNNNNNYNANGYMNGYINGHMNRDMNGLAKATIVGGCSKCGCYHNNEISKLETMTSYQKTATGIPCHIESKTGMTEYPSFPDDKGQTTLRMTDFEVQRTRRNAQWQRQRERGERRDGMDTFSRLQLSGSARRGCQAFDPNNVFKGQSLREPDFTIDETSTYTQSHPNNNNNNNNNGSCNKSFINHHNSNGHFNCHNNSITPGNNDEHICDGNCGKCGNENLNSERIVCYKQVRAVIEVIFDLDWNLYETLYRPKSAKKIMYIFDDTTLQDVYNFIKTNTMRHTLHNKRFAVISNVRFESKKCIFHHRTYKGGKNINAPILTYYHANELPKRLPLRDDKSIHQNNSYKVSIKIKPQFKYDWTETTKNCPRSDISIAQLFDHSIFDNENNNNNNKHKANTNKNSCNIYKVDSMQRLDYSEWDHRYAYLWRKYELKYKSAQELIDMLLHMYDEFLKETKMKDKERVKNIQQLTTLTRIKYECAEHRRIGQPLSPPLIMAVILFSDTSMYTNLTRAQLTGDNLDKYIVFDYCLFWAITKLDCFMDKRSKKCLNIYSGAGNVKFDILDLLSNNSNNKNNNNNNSGSSSPSLSAVSSSASSWSCSSSSSPPLAPLSPLSPLSPYAQQYIENKKVMIDFIKHTSFSVHPNVAKDFMNGQQEGVLLILNDVRNIVAGDISWISRFPKEGEILVRRHSGSSIADVIYSKDFNFQIVLLGDATVKDTQRTRCVPLHTILNNPSKYSNFFNSFNKNGK